MQFGAVRQPGRLRRGPDRRRRPDRSDRSHRPRSASLKPGGECHGHTSVDIHLARRVDDRERRRPLALRPDVAAHIERHDRDRHIGHPYPRDSSADRALPGERPSDTDNQRADNQLPDTDNTDNTDKAGRGHSGPGAGRERPPGRRGRRPGDRGGRGDQLHRRAARHNRDKGHNVRREASLPAARRPGGDPGCHTGRDHGWSGDTGRGPVEDRGRCLSPRRGAEGRRRVQRWLRRRRCLREGRDRVRHRLRGPGAGGGRSGDRHSDCFGRGPGRRPLAGLDAADGRRRGHRRRIDQPGFRRHGPGLLHGRCGQRARL